MWLLCGGGEQLSPHQQAPLLWGLRWLGGGSLEKAVLETSPPPTCIQASGACFQLAEAEGTSQDVSRDSGVYTPLC